MVAYSVRSDGIEVSLYTVVWTHNTDHTTIQPGCELQELLPKQAHGRIGAACEPNDGFIFTLRPAQMQYAIIWTMDSRWIDARITCDQVAIPMTSFERHGARRIGQLGPDLTSHHAVLTSLHYKLESQHYDWSVSELDRLDASCRW